MSRIKTPNLFEKFERTVGGYYPLAALLGKYILLIAASVCGITVYHLVSLRFSCPWQSQVVCIYLMPISNVDAVTQSYSFHNNCAISSFSKAYVWLDGIQP